MLLKIPIPVGNRVEELDTLAKVARTITANDSGYQVAAEFIDIGLRQQDMVVGFVLNETTKSKKLS